MCFDTDQSFLKLYTFIVYVFHSKGIGLEHVAASPDNLSRFFSTYAKTKADFAQPFRYIDSRRRGGLVVERRAPEREVGGSILSQVSMLYP